MSAKKLHAHECTDRAINFDLLSLDSQGKEYILASVSDRRLTCLKHRYNLDTQVEIICPRSCVHHMHACMCAGAAAVSS
jgi:hypothetical protein